MKNHTFFSNSGKDGKNLKIFDKYYSNKYHHNINDTCDSVCRTEVVNSIRSARVTKNKTP